MSLILGKWNQIPLEQARTMPNMIPDFKSHKLKQITITFSFGINHSQNTRSKHPINVSIMRCTLIVDLPSCDLTWYVAGWFCGVLGYLFKFAFTHQGDDASLCWQEVATSMIIANCYVDILQDNQDICVCFSNYLITFGIAGRRWK